MNQTTAKKVMEYSKLIAQQAAEICKGEDNELNNQVAVSSLMLATCVMARFFNEEEELLEQLLAVMNAAVQEMPPAEEFMSTLQ